MSCRDLKLDNTLLDDSQPPVIKVCDFGFAKDWTESANMYTHIGWVLPYTGCMAGTGMLDPCDLGQLGRV